MLAVGLTQPLMSLPPYFIRLSVVLACLMTMNAGCNPPTPSFGADPALVNADDRVKERQRMVETQLKPQERGIKHKGVLRAMAEVPRHEFVPLESRAEAYEDRPLPIGYDQTISQPYIVAFMTEALDPKPADRVLEIGTGSGYQAAVMAKLVREVYTIEIVEPLGRRAQADLQRLGFTNVHVRVGDGYAGWPEQAPFDTIIVTCAPGKVPKPLTEQLKEGGRMIIPVGAPGSQKLLLIRKEAGQLKEKRAMDVRFVPMTGQAQGR